MASTSSTASAAGVPAAGRSDQVRRFSSVAQATLALGCKTYTGTIAQGGGEIPTVTPAQ